MTKNQAFYAVAGLVFIGCASSDISYAGRNNIDVARSRCVELANTSGYRDVAVDSIERKGNAEWRVRLVVRKTGEIGGNAANTARAPIESVSMISSDELGKLGYSETLERVSWSLSTAR